MGLLNVEDPEEEAPAAQVEQIGAGVMVGGIVAAVVVMGGVGLFVAHTIKKRSSAKVEALELEMQKQKARHAAQVAETNRARAALRAEQQRAEQAARERSFSAENTLVSPAAKPSVERQARDSLARTEGLAQGVGGAHPWPSSASCHGRGRP